MEKGLAVVLDCPHRSIESGVVEGGLTSGEVLIIEDEVVNVGVLLSDFAFDRSHLPLEAFLVGFRLVPLKTLELWVEVASYCLVGGPVLFTRVHEHRCLRHLSTTDMHCPRIALISNWGDLH